MVCNFEDNDRDDELSLEARQLLMSVENNRNDAKKCVYDNQALGIKNNLIEKYSNDPELVRKLSNNTLEDSSSADSTIIKRVAFFLIKWWKQAVTVKKKKYACFISN